MSELASIKELLVALTMRRLADRPAAPMKAPVPTRPTQRHEGEWLLVVDGGREDGATIAQRLRAVAMDVRVTGSAADASALLACPPPAVVVLDGDLSGELTAADFATLLRTSPEWMAVPIVLCCGTGCREVDARSTFGADYWVPKGNLEMLAGVVDAAVRRGRAR